MTGTPRTADSPYLTRGQHLDPAEGRCVMEQVALVAGEGHTDRPRCTHPAVATVARVVNDELDDLARQELLELVPRLVGLAGEPGVDDRVSPRVVLAVVAAASRSGAGGHGLARHAARARRRLARSAEPGTAAPEPSGAVAHLGRWIAAAAYRRGPLEHAVGAAAVAVRDLPTRLRAGALVGMLRAAVEASEPGDRQSPHTPSHTYCQNVPHPSGCITQQQPVFRRQSRLSQPRPSQQQPWQWWRHQSLTTLHPHFRADAAEAGPRVARRERASSSP